MRVIRNARTRQSRFATLVLSGLLALLFVGSTAVAQDSTRPDTLLTPAQWSSFQKNIIQGVHSTNPGVMESSLGQIARFGQFMTFDRDDVIAVVRIYRENGVFRVRQQAVTAIGKMNDRWGIEFLDMLAATETSPGLQKTMVDVVDAYWAKNGGNPYKNK
jgi:hypothetical protein